MRTIGIFSNPQKDVGLAMTCRIMKMLDARGVAFTIEGEIADHFRVKYPPHEPPQLLIVLGGDGTMLSAAREYAPYGTLLWGINLGRIGFLQETEINDLDRAVDQILEGNFLIEERMMLRAKVINDEGICREDTLAMNEAVISQRRILRMVNLKVSVNDFVADDLYCDGVIVSTPTGSTGYSLSAGGPVVVPRLEVMLITPVCAHSLRSTNLVIAGSDVVKVWPKPDSKYVALSIDGRLTIPICNGELVEVQSAEVKAKFVRLKEHNFFELLKEKLSEWNTLK